MSEIPHGERVLISTGPSPWLIVLTSWRTLVGAAIVAAIGLLTGRWCGSPTMGRWIYWLAIGFGLLRLVWAFLDWGCRSYVLTDRRVMRTRGILSRTTADLPLGRLQNLTLDRSVGERLFRVGTIGFATAGTAWVEAHWVSIPDPQGVMEQVRRAMNASNPSPPSTPRPVVIGLAGAIGAGKSRVAAEFARLGAVVIDSDAEAKGALDRPEVREQLRSWWGDQVIGADGRVDRKAVARIIFADPGERLRLEALVHPIVRTTRAAAIAEATKASSPAVVVDAPLLFEAGVDKECDTVIFVDAPRDIRIKRVRESRGWDEAELTRRENQQMDISEKRRRSAHVITNTGSEQDLARQTERLYTRFVRQTPPNASPAV